MPIPKTRRELVDLVSMSFEKLREEIKDADPEIGDLPCVENWSVKDLLVVRAWWTQNVVDWIVAGQRGMTPVTPAPGYGWTETPRLNSDLVQAARKEPLEKVWRRLERGSKRVLATIDALDDRALLKTGVFEWAGKWPISRWISMNTARQYTTARTHIRRALRGQKKRS